MASLARSTRAQARLARTFTPTVTAQLAQIEADLGGRAAIVSMLVLAPLTPDLEYLLGLLGTPEHADRPLAELCAIGNILPGDLVRQLAGAALLRGKVLAAQRIGAGIAAVAEDVMRRAAPYQDACGTCLGSGSVTPEPTPDTPNPGPGPCETCAGTGVLLYRPDLERQKLAIEMAQLLPKSGGIQIAQINQSGDGGGGHASGRSAGATFDAVQQIIDRALYGTDDADAGAGDVEAELVEDDGVEGAPADGEGEGGCGPEQSDPAGGGGQRP